MIIEPDLSNRDHFGAPREIRQPLERIRSSLQSVVRVDSYRGVNEVVPVREPDARL